MCNLRSPTHHSQGCKPGALRWHLAGLAQAWCWDQIPPDTTHAPGAAPGRGHFKLSPPPEPPASTWPKSSNLKLCPYASHAWCSKQDWILFYPGLNSFHVHKEHPRRSIFCEQSPEQCPDSKVSLDVLDVFFPFSSHFLPRFFEVFPNVLAFSDGTSASAVPWQHPKMGTRTFSLFSCTNLVVKTQKR